MGSARRGFSTSISRASTSTWPDARFAFAVPAGRGRTGPGTLTTHSPPQTLGLAEYGRGVRIEHDLQQALAVAQVHENHAAMVTATMHPPGHGNGRSDETFVDVAAVMSAHGHGRQIQCRESVDDRSAPAHGRCVPRAGRDAEAWSLGPLAPRPACRDPALRGTFAARRRPFGARTPFAARRALAISFERRQASRSRLIGRACAGVAGASFSFSTRLRLLSLSDLKSVSYQPLPERRKRGADIRRRSACWPHAGTFPQRPVR